MQPKDWIEPKKKTIHYQIKITKRKRFSDKRTKRTGLKRKDKVEMKRSTLSTVTPNCQKRNGQDEKTGLKQKDRVETTRIKVKRTVWSHV